LNLNRKFTGGSKDKNNRTVTRSKQRLSVDVNDSRKTVTQSLSRTGFGDTNDVATGESHGPALGLNGSGAVKSLSLDFGQNILREAGFIEGLNGARNVPALDSHLVLLAEVINFLLGAVGDVGVLLVESLFELGKGVQVYIIRLATRQALKRNESS